MLRNDYLLRIIREACGALARILGLIKGRCHAEASAEIEQTLQDSLGLTTGMALYLDESSLLEMLQVGGAVDADRLRLLATLLVLRGDVRAGEGAISEAAPHYLRALRLLLNPAAVDTTRPLPPEFVSVAEVVRRLDGYDLPAELQQRLLAYYESIGSYAAAEDLLFELLGQAETPESLLQLGLAFFQRLRNRSDAELKRGGLTRAEVEDALAELAALIARQAPGAAPPTSC